MAFSSAAASFVNVWTMVARLSKSMTWATSCARRRFDEPDGRLLRGRDLVLHAGAGVEQQRERDGQLRSGEEGDVLLHAVLEDEEVGLLEVHDVALRLVGHGDVERDDLDAAAERRDLRVPGSDEDDDAAGGREPCARARLAP